MSDYIKREDALNASKIVYIEYLETDDDQYIECEADYFPVVFKKDIEKIPAADVVERKHGKWVEMDEGHYICSACEGFVSCHYEYNFCPNCGADMRQQEKTE